MVRVSNIVQSKNYLNVSLRIKPLIEKKTNPRYRLSLSNNNHESYRYLNKSDINPDSNALL